MPTDRNLNYSSRPRHAQNRHYTMPVTGPLSLELISWPAVGVGLHLLSLAFARMVAGMSLPGMRLSCPSRTSREPGGLGLGSAVTVVSCGGYHASIEGD